MKFPSVAIAVISGLHKLFVAAVANVKTVRVSLAGADRVLSLAEVQVFNQNNMNVAAASYGSTASQSSEYTLGSYPASIAINGITTSGFTRTNDQTNPWWKVDLNGSHDVKRVVLWNRSDCCGEKLSYANVELMDSSGNVLEAFAIGDATEILTFTLPPPTQSPTSSPSATPTQSPSTMSPSLAPTSSPTTGPTTSPTIAPTTTGAPSDAPTKSPTNSPSLTPTNSPTTGPTTSPTIAPTTTGAPSDAPTKSPTNSPSLSPGKWYPDWEGDNLGCIQDRKEPAYMTLNPAPYLFENQDDCCQKHYPWSFSKCMGDGVSSSGAMWYANWMDAGDQSCKNDGNAPEYMVNNPSMWLYDTQKACCAKYFGYKLSSCMGSAAANEGSGLFYPDWEGENTGCLEDMEDSLAPQYMQENPTGWMFSTIDECCTKYYYYDLPGCKSSPSSSGAGGDAGSNKWFMDWTAGKCVKDCITGTGCGGFAQSWDALYETQAACCKEKNWWNSECTD